MTSFVSCFGGLLDGGLGFCRGMGGVLWDLILLLLPFHSFFCGIWCWFSLDGSAAFFSVFPDGVGEFLVVLLQHSPEGWLNYLLFLRLLFLVFLGCKALAISICTTAFSICFMVCWISLLISEKFRENGPFHLFKNFHATGELLAKQSHLCCI